MSGVVSALLNPFAASTRPKAPAAEPQLWTLLAAARRELETTFEMRSALRQPPQTPTTGEVVSTDTTLIGADVAAAQNSLTYTPEPELRDQGAVLVQRAIRAVSDVIGVDLYAQINSLIASDSPPRLLTLGLDTRQTTFTTDDDTVWQVWELTPPDASGKTVIAIHGGGFIYEPNLLHWIDYTTMARDTGATVIVPIYPLATTEAGRATVVVTDMADFIAQQIAASGGPENVSVYGDSAGSTLAMSAARLLLLRGDPVPSSMVLLSLAAVYGSDNPDIDDIDDPILDPDGGTYDSHWMDGLDPKDPLISPLFFESDVLQELPPTTIYVGEIEILLPDMLLLHERAVAENAPISVVVGTGLVHDWPLSELPIYSQTGVVRLISTDSSDLQAP